MTVLAIDPGPTTSAAVLWDGERVINAEDYANADLLRILSRQEQADMLVIEQVVHYGTGMPAGAEVFDTVFWSGRFAQAFSSAGGTFDRLSRPKIKMHLCGSMRAKDPNIRQALIDRFGVVGTKKAPGRLFGISGHKWAALAVAVTWWDLTCGKDNAA